MMSRIPQMYAVFFYFAFFFACTLFFMTHWEKDPDLASVRNPAWLAAMPPADRKAWEAFWNSSQGYALGCWNRPFRPIASSP